MKAGSFHVDKVNEENGLLSCTGTRLDTQEANVTLREVLLDSKLVFSKPQDRLFAGQIDRMDRFALRYRARKFQSEQYRMPWSGLRGQRTSLNPHQLHIAHDVGRRHAPRVLLADEVGLGKTIEAGMILHQQLLSGAAERMLIVVPETLQHQWLVEMLRRFQPAFLAVRRRALRRSAARCLQSVRNRTAGDLLFRLRASQQAAPGAPVRRRVGPDGGRRSAPPGVERERRQP